MLGKSQIVSKYILQKLVFILFEEFKLFTVMPFVTKKSIDKKKKNHMVFVCAFILTSTLKRNIHYIKFITKLPPYMKKPLGHLM